MKVKNLFSNRSKSKKKRTAQQASSVNEVDANNASSNKLIIPQDTKHGGASGKENDPSDAANSVECYSVENVVLRSKARKSPGRIVEDDDKELIKPRGDSASSNSSVKVKSKRPWSFIEQLRRQDSGESAYSTGSSARTSQQAEDLSTYTPPPHDDTKRHSRGDTPSHGNRNSCTLPRMPTLEQFDEASKTAQRQEYSAKRRTMDFRFFNFFKRSSSGESSVQSDTMSPTSSGRSSLRGKNKGKKSSKKRRDEVSTSVKSKGGVEDSRIRSFSDGGESSATLTFDEALQVPPPGLYDSALKLNSVNEQPEHIPRKDIDRRVPINGEPVFCLGEDAKDPTRCASETALSKGSRKYMRRSDPTSGGHSILRMQMSEGSAVVRSSSDSADSRRSSFVCEPRDSPLPEDSIASFDSSAYLAARSRKMYAVPTMQNQKICRALSNEILRESCGIGQQTFCSQSVSNLTMASVEQSSSYIPRSASDVDKPKYNKKTPMPSPHQQKQEEHIAFRAGGNDSVAPPSPVLRVIAYPGVVLRRDKQKRHKQRPNSAFADQRMKHVMSLNMEDLPTYSQLRCEMAESDGNRRSYDNILALQENGTSSKRGSSGVQFASTASGRARRRGATLSNYGQRASSGFPTAASVEDGLDSLSSSNYGSKQSLSDRLDDDEILNALLGRSHAVTHTSSGNLRSQEPSSKRAKAIRKSVVSLANLISPGKPNQKSGKLQRSSSFKESGSTPSSTTAAVYSFKPYRPPTNTPNKTKNNRRSRLWCETFDHNGLNEAEIKWQEAIFELYQGERDLVQDLTMAKQTYRDSMVTLKMLSDEDVTLIFGKLGCLLPLHEELLSKLEEARGEDGRTLGIGCIFVEWFPRISTAYRDYCANQSDAKYALDAAVEKDARVRDFLQRCLESPFSRKLDLWSYLDLPRTRLVKYPLLLQNVLKRTPTELIDEKNNLNRVMEIIGEIIEKVDETTGEQQCRYIRSKLEYLDDKHKSPFVDNSRLMLCAGQLKNNRGTKMHVFLFEEAFVLTRQTTRSNKVSYQVYRHPLPLRTLVVDTNEGDKLSGSFRGGILSSEKVKHSFRVRSEELNVNYTLQASEEHDRKQWINAIQDALAKYKAKHPEPVPANQPQISRRRATYDPSSKKANSRSVLRSSSDKSNASEASSTDKSSVREESQEDDASLTSEDNGPWRRTRSQTVNPSILSSKSASSVSRKSSGSSTKSEKFTEHMVGKNEKFDGKKVKDRLKHIENEAHGPPSPLKDAPRKLSASISRHFSLNNADKPKVVIRTRSDETEKARNKCQRSRSLTSSPQTVKSVVARFGAKRFSHGKIGTSGLPGPTAGKPPIAPSSSPFSVRRAPSLKTPCTIHEARSTPNLAVERSTSFCTRRSSKRLSHLAAQNCSNSVGNLRKGLAGGSAIDLRSEAVERADDARLIRRMRSNNKAPSEGDSQDIDVIPACVFEKSVDNSNGEACSQPEPASEGEKLKDGPEAPTKSIKGISDASLLTEKGNISDVYCPDDVVQAKLSDAPISFVVTSAEPAAVAVTPDECVVQSADDILAEFCRRPADEEFQDFTASSKDLISLDKDNSDVVMDESEHTIEVAKMPPDTNEDGTATGGEDASLDVAVDDVSTVEEDDKIEISDDKDGAELAADLAKTENVDVDVEGVLLEEVRESSPTVEDIVTNSEESAFEVMDCEQKHVEEETECPSTDNDEGIVRDVGFASDVDNNNFQQTSDKTLPDSETDEHISLEVDGETSHCCRNEITDENSNRQFESFQAIERLM